MEGCTAPLIASPLPLDGHTESLHVPVMEAEDGAGVVRWIRELGGPVARK
jgi:hypothetical protein